MKLKLTMPQDHSKPSRSQCVLFVERLRDTLANKLLLKKQSFRAEMKEGTFMEPHLKQMKEITDQLAAIGAPISNEDQVVICY